MQMANVNINSKRKLPSLRELSKEIPVSKKAQNVILETREFISELFNQTGKANDNFLIIVGPCSIHNLQKAYEYAERLAVLQSKLSKNIKIAMRVCGDKPRTRKDWEGFMKDPHLDGSYDMTYGFTEMRRLILKINELGIPVATEALDETAFNVISDLVSYGWIGARTIADSKKRALASGLSMPVGMKNPDHGPLEIAINAIDYARHPGVFVGPDEDNVVSVNETKGNLYTHLILRGNANGQNHDSVSIKEACQKLTGAGLPNRVVVDCSHGNSTGDYLNQIKVANSLIGQIKAGEKGIAGIMLESYLKGGKQSGKRIGASDVSKDIDPEISVTDACLPIQDTESLILNVNQELGNLKK